MLSRTRPGPCPPEGFPDGASGKEPACQCGRPKRLRFDPWGGNGNPFEYSCLKNPVDRGAWWATVHGVAKSWSGLSMHTNVLEDQKEGHCSWNTARVWGVRGALSPPSFCQENLYTCIQHPCRPSPPPHPSPRVSEEEFRTWMPLQTSWKIPNKPHNTNTTAHRELHQALNTRF